MGVKVRERPKGSGVWWIFIEHQGKRKAKKVGKYRRLANEVAKKIEARLILGDLDLEKSQKSELPRFKDYADTWLESYIKSLKRESTYERYRGILQQHVYPSIGNVYRSMT
jgi:integrase